jgi:hypothetical protein
VCTAIGMDATENTPFRPAHWLAGCCLATAVASIDSQSLLSSSVHMSLWVHAHVCVCVCNLLSYLPRMFIYSTYLVLPVFDYSLSRLLPLPKCNNAWWQLTIQCKVRKNSTLVYNYSIPPQYILENHSIPSSSVPGTLFLYFTSMLQVEVCSHRNHSDRSCN